MTTVTNPQLAVGSYVERAGFFTKRHVLGDLSEGAELERRIGYSPGTLSRGWFVLEMVDRPPTPDEFTVAGYSHFSGGRVEGHTAHPGQHAEQALLAMRIDLRRVKHALAERFTVTGAERLTKIYPVIKCQIYWHPDPNPIPQWELAVPMRFRVAAFFGGVRGSP